MKNLQIFFEVTLTLQMRKKKSNKDRNKKEVPSKFM